MAFKSKDGKNFGNKQQKDTYDRAKSPKESESAPKGEESGGEGGEMDGDIHEMVAQHGPAEHVEIEHHHEGGQHTKTSTHGGKKHVSHHGSAMEAHQAGMTAAGVEPMQQEQQAQPPMAMAGGMGGGIPGM